MYINALKILRVFVYTEEKRERARVREKGGRDTHARKYMHIGVYIYVSLYEQVIKDGFLSYWPDQKVYSYIYIYV